MAIAQRITEPRSFLSSISSKYHVADADGAVYTKIWSVCGHPLGVVGLFVLVFCSVVVALAGCVQCLARAAPTRLQVLVTRVGNLLCAITWGVLCWEQVNSFPDCALASVVCGSAAALHVVVICAQRCQRPQHTLLESHRVGPASYVEKLIFKVESDDAEVGGPLLGSRKGALPDYVESASEEEQVAEARTLSECLIFDNENMPGTVVVTSVSSASSERVAKFYQSKLLTNLDKSKDM